MISSFGNSFILGTLSVLASGYIVYDAPILRWFWPGKYEGYVLYFRIITTGLVLLFLSLFIIDFSFLRFLLMKPEDAPLKPEDALFLTFLLSFVIRVSATGIVYCGRKFSPEWGGRLKLKELAGKGLEQFIWEKIDRREMVLITLESRKVYAGWLLEIPDNESKKWLRFAPQWSGSRKESSTIDIKIDYSDVLDQSQLENNRMLIQVEKIVTVQPFDIHIFRQFNPASN